MRNLIKNVTALAFLSIPALVPAFTTVARAEVEAAQPAAVKPDLARVKQHLVAHQTYPATRAELLASCHNLMEFSAGEKRWFADWLPDGTYRSADEVMKTISRN